ncbi:MAG: DUF4112 domain-containing protein [Terracidiphilus sp.]|jgi:hypothetical protein
MTNPNQISQRTTPGDRTIPPVGELLGPNRWNQGAWLFRDSTLHGLEILLDEAVRVPGTGIRFGLGGIIGLVPGLGDVLAGLLSVIIPLAAWIRGVPYVTLVRMAANLGIAVLVGSIPVLGDFFDVAWKPNRRNYQLLCLHLDEPQRHTQKDWIFLLLLAGALALIFFIPLALAIWLLIWVGHALTSATPVGY